MEGLMLAIKLKARKTYDWIRQPTHVKEIAEYITSLKWKFCGHTMGPTDGRCNQKIQFWKPLSPRRGRGRPPLR